MSQPNIIFLHSHNTGRYVQPYGHNVPTPAIQRLAEEGVLFRNAFAAAPTCSPSRASFLSGQYPHNCGMLGLAHRGWGMDHSHHVVKTLGDAGYFTALCGIEHTIPFKSGAQPYEGYDRAIESRTGRAESVGPAVAEFLKDAPQQPFFLSVGLNETHRPYPPAEPDKYPAEDPRYCTPPRPLPDTPVTRQDTADFKACARIMDHCWAQILDTLDDSGLAENTLVCCFSDHGLQWPLNMCNLTDHGLAVYLVVRGPGGFDGGKVVDEMVSLIDLVPTACDLAGATIPDWVDGVSIRPLVNGEVENLHDELFGEITFHASYEPTRSVRTKRFKYIRRYDGRDKLVLPNIDDTPSKDEVLRHGLTEEKRHQEMLYDLFFDPDEVNNLLESPAHTSVLDDLRARLDRYMNESEDPLLKGHVPAPSGAMFNDVDGLSPREEPIVAE